MTLDAFIAERQARWAELESAIKRAKRGRIRTQSSGDIERFGLLLRQASSDLAIARRDHPDAPATEYLNTLCARAHPLLYRGTPMRLGSIWSFFATALPRSCGGKIVDRIDRASGNTPAAPSPFASPLASRARHILALNSAIHFVFARYLTVRAMACRARPPRGRCPAAIARIGGCGPRVRVARIGADTGGATDGRRWPARAASAP